MKIADATTGEIIDLDDMDLSSEQGIIDTYRMIKSLTSVLKKKNAELNEKLKELIGQREEMNVGPYILKACSRQIRSYPVSTLRQFFDEDQLMECMNVSVTKVDELAKILPDEERRALKMSANVTEQQLPPKLI